MRMCIALVVIGICLPSALSLNEPHENVARDGAYPSELGAEPTFYVGTNPDWAKGPSYRVWWGHRRFPPCIKPPCTYSRGLGFYAEVHKWDPATSARVVVKYERNDPYVFQEAVHYAHAQALATSKPAYVRVSVNFTESQSNSLPMDRTLQIASTAGLVIEAYAIDGVRPLLTPVGGCGTFFDVLPGAKASFYGLQLSTGGMLVPGGIKINNAVVVIEDCGFLQNYGGALHITNDAHVTLSDSDFTHNGALNTTTQGGAIYMDGSFLNVTNTRFSGNTAVNGSAIYMQLSTMNITEATFSDNRAQEAGALYVINSTVSCNSHVEYLNNKGPFFDSSAASVYAQNVAYTSYDFNCQTELCTFYLTGESVEERKKTPGFTAAGVNTMQGKKGKPADNIDGYEWRMPGMTPGIPGMPPMGAASSSSSSPQNPGSQMYTGY